MKIKADPVLPSTAVEITTVARDGKNYKISMLPVEFANGWLFIKIRNDPVHSQVVTEIVTPSAGGDQKTAVTEMVTMRLDSWQVHSTCVGEMTTQLSGSG
ncbi:hypothetical protein GGQ74_000328 [Desulfobaculum xiamenense]|uniref:Antirepressor protein ant N-terminal domain-containing protein n=1 Tax=Desulfobaculum xiamenense TaxID=995050 RepID=A0A846QE91_9BACT|nr:hypothetical protein [Desulfobaculum xiamenense]